MFMKWESVVKKCLSYSPLLLKAKNKFLKRIPFCMLVWCIFLLNKICYSRMIKIDKYFVSLEIEG